MKILISESQFDSLKKNNIEQSIDEDISAGSVIVYHRTKMSEENIKSLNSGFIPGDGQAYGRGLYSTYDLNSQLRPNMKQYGNIVVEFSITKFNKILILNSDECKKIYGRVLSVDEQMKKILKGDYVKFIKNFPPNLKNYIPNTGVNGPIANEISRINNFQLEFDGLVFIGGTDGKVLVLFETNLANPLRYTTNDGKSWKTIKTKESLNIGKDKRGYSKFVNYLNFKRGSLDFESFSEKNKYEIITQKIKNKIPFDSMSEYEFYIKNFKTSDEVKYDIIYQMLLRNSQFFNKFDIEDEKIQLMAVKIDPHKIQYIKNPSEELQLVAVKQDGYLIQYIKNPSEQVQLIAVNQYGNAIQFIKNPSEQVQLDAVKKNGESIKYIQNPSEEVQLAAVQQNRYAIEYILDKGITLSNQLQLAAVQQDANSIKYIQNPSEELQLAAVQQDGKVIQFIKNPSEQVQLDAVNQDGQSIYYIKNPSEQVQLIAVNQYGNAIQFIKNPSEEVQLAAVQQNGQSIKYIQNPSEEVQLVAVQKDGYAFLNILKKGITPSEEVQLAAVKRNGREIKNIENPSEELQLVAVKQNGYSIEYIQNPSEQVQLGAVQQNGYAIQIIKNPSEQVQLAAVQQNGNAIRFIINKGITPSEEVQLAAVQQDGNSIRYMYKNGNRPSMEVMKAAESSLMKADELSLNRDQPINEEVFKYDDLTDDEKNKAYEIFRDSYQNATGSSWDKMKFSSRASNWTFYGVKDKGFVVVRKQKSGMNKLTGVAGDLKSISIGIEELNKLEEPTWGMADKKIVNVLTGRYNFISPPAFVVKMLIKFIPSEVFGGVQYVINKDGSLTFNYSDVGDATKYFFGNKKYFQSLLKNVSMNSIVKFAIQKLIS